MTVYRINRASRGHHPVFLLETSADGVVAEFYGSDVAYQVVDMLNDAEQRKPRYVPANTPAAEGEIIA